MIIRKRTPSWSGVVKRSWWLTDLFKQMFKPLGRYGKGKLKAEEKQIPKAPSLLMAMASLGKEHSQHQGGDGGR